MKSKSWNLTPGPRSRNSPTCSRCLFMRRRFMNSRAGSKRKRKGIKTTTRKSRKSWKISRLIFNSTNAPSHNSNTKTPLSIAISFTLPLSSKNSNTKSPNSAGTSNTLKSSCDSPKPNVISTPTKSTKKTKPKNYSKSNLMNS